MKFSEELLQLRTENSFLILVNKGTEIKLTLGMSSNELHLICM